MANYVGRARTNYFTVKDVVEAYDVPEQIFRGLEPLFTLPEHWMGRWKGGSKVILSADNLPGFDVDKLTGYLRQHGIRHQIETTTEYTPNKEIS